MNEIDNNELLKAIQDPNFGYKEFEKEINTIIDEDLGEIAGRMLNELCDKARLVYDNIKMLQMLNHIDTVREQVHKYRMYVKVVDMWNKKGEQE